MAIKIKYKKKHLRKHLIFAIGWFVLWLIWASLNEKTKNNWLYFGYLILSILYLVLYLYQKQQQYLTIDNESIKINDLFGEKLYLKEIEQIKKIGDDYILKTNKKSLTINTYIIDPNSLIKLTTELEKLNSSL